MVAQYIDPSDKVLELGTCTGLIGLICAEKCGSDNVTSYEMNTDLEYIISRNFKLNQNKPELVMKAITCDGRNVSMSAGDPLGAEIGICSSNNTIKSDKFNDVIKQFEPTAVVMDIEGTEEELLATMVPGTVKKIIVEMHPKKIGKFIIARDNILTGVKPKTLGRETIDNLIEHLDGLGFDKKFDFPAKSTSHYNIYFEHQSISSTSQP